MLIPISDLSLFLFPLSEILFPEIFASLTSFYHLSLNHMSPFQNAFAKNPTLLHPLGLLCQITLFHLHWSTSKYMEISHLLFTSLLFNFLPGT